MKHIKITIEVHDIHRCPAYQNSGDEGLIKRIKHVLSYFTPYFCASLGDTIKVEEIISPNTNK